MRTGKWGCVRMLHWKELALLRDPSRLAAWVGSFDSLLNISCQWQVSKNALSMHSQRSAWCDLAQLIDWTFKGKNRNFLNPIGPTVSFKRIHQSSTLCGDTNGWILADSRPENYKDLLFKFFWFQQIKFFLLQVQQDLAYKRRWVDKQAANRMQKRICAVCEEAAHGMYFGALVCLPCKVSYSLCSVWKGLRRRCRSASLTPHSLISMKVTKVMKAIPK